MQTLLIVSLLFAAFSLVLTGVTHISVRAACRRKPRLGSCPAISVLKPLKGNDDDLYQNLASLARQDYPEFEILFGCEDPCDEALVVARRVARDFPQVKIQIVAGVAQIGMNPKVNTLAMLSQRAEHDCLLVSDSNVRARPDYLRAMASELGDARVGLVSSVLVGTGERSLGARLDNLQMNSSVVRAVCGAHVVAAHPCVIGKSMLFRRSALAALGGFEIVRDVLAEDYVLGRAFSSAGFRVVLSAHRLESVSAERSLKEFFQRQIRWSQMRRRLFPALYLFEPLQSPSPWLLIALALVLLETPPFETETWSLGIVLGLLMRVGSDAAIARALRGAPLRPLDHAAMLLKDILLLGIWAVGALRRTVLWRGNRMRIARGSRLLPVQEHERQRAVLEGA